MSGLRISPDLELPLEAVTEAMGMLAARRAGKSNGAVVMAEEMFRNHLHWVAIDPKGDWWGMRGEGTGPGLPIPIFGGAHGDVPLEPGAGQIIADLVVDQRVTCILDVSGFASDADRIRFLLAFGDRLFRKKNGSQEPTHVFFEEADEYAPQRAFPEQQRLVHTMARILKQGGARGLGGTVISQRSAVVHKDLLSQIQTLFALRTTGPQDRKAIKDWVSFAGENPEIVESLPGLEDGEAWVWSPNFLRTTKRFRFRRRSTFDSGATPKIGASRQAPATLADVDLGAIATLMQSSIEKADAEDPRKLRARIRELEQSLKDLHAAAESREPEKVTETVHVPLLEPGQLEQLIGFRDQAIAAVTAFHEDLEHVTAQLRRVGGGAITPPANVIGASPAPVPRPAPPPKRVVASQAAASERATAVLAETVGQADAPAQLSPYGRRLIETLASRHPLRVNRAQLAVLSKSSPKSSAFDGAIALIRRLGLVEVSGGDLLLTAAGWEAVGGSPSTPSTPAELLEHWRSVLPAAAVPLLDALVAAHPGTLTRAELAERSQRSPNSSSFDAGISTLRKMDLLTGDRDGFGVSPALVDG